MAANGQHPSHCLRCSICWLHARSLRQTLYRLIRRNAPLRRLHPPGHHTFLRPRSRRDGVGGGWRWNRRIDGPGWVCAVYYCSKAMLIFSQLGRDGAGEISRLQSCAPDSIRIPVYSICHVLAASQHIPYMEMGSLDFTYLQRNHWPGTALHVLPAHSRPC